MYSILIYAGILWYGAPIVAISIGIYGTIYFAKLLNITKKQILVASPAGIILSALGVAFQYFTSTHMYPSLYENIFIYTFLTIAPFIMMYLVYFIIAGRKNLRKEYNFDISGKWPKEIKKLKNLNK